MLPEWQSYFSSNKNRINFSITLFFLVLILILLPQFLKFVENRAGFAFEDPVLNIFQPIEVTWFTFSLIYLGLAGALFHLSHKPGRLVLALKVYTLTGIIRIIAMYLLPLNPPETMIALDDPFVQFFGDGQILTKDLFFSGHTSTMFIFFLTAFSKPYKIIFLAATILIGILVIIQHVHYSIDVFAAPFFAYGAYRISVLIDKKLNAE